MADWYLYRPDWDPPAQGPFALEVIAAWLREGSLRPDTLCARLGDARWRLVAELADATEAAEDNGPKAWLALNIARSGQPRALPPPRSSANDNDAFSVLRTNLAAERPADVLEEGDLRALGPFAVTQRMRDYLVCVGLAVLIAGLVLLLAPANPVLIAILVGALALFVGGVAWVLFGVMEPY